MNNKTILDACCGSKMLGGLVMEELKRCPFCGREATINNAGGKYQAWCKHCCCIHMGEFYNTEAEAIAAWNRRVEG